VGAAFGTSEQQQYERIGLANASPAPSSTPYHFLPFPSSTIDRQNRYVSSIGTQIRGSQFPPKSVSFQLPFFILLPSLLPYSSLFWIADRQADIINPVVYPVLSLVMFSLPVPSFSLSHLANNSSSSSLSYTDPLPTSNFNAF